MREISDRGIPVVAAIPEMFILPETCICLEATLLTAAWRRMEFNSLVLRPVSIINPVSGSKSCNNARLATALTSFRSDVTSMLVDSHRDIYPLRPQ
jgi:hypothetical protein